MKLYIRKLEPNETESALSLVWAVFQKYESPDYSIEGTAEFDKSIHDPDFIARLTFYGAFRSAELIGVIAVRSSGSHIALLFVAGEYHRKGIGRMLFETVLTNCTADSITVNSSPFAVPFYHKLGFTDTDAEQTVNGLRFTPMEYRLHKQA